MYDINIVKLSPDFSQESQDSSNSLKDLTEQEMMIVGGSTIAGGKVTINAGKIVGNGAVIAGEQSVSLNAPVISLPNSTIIADYK